MPVYTIASAAGFDGSVAVEKLMEQDNPELGYDPATGNFSHIRKFKDKTGWGICVMIVQ